MKNIFISVGVLLLLVFVLALTYLPIGASDEQYQKYVEAGKTSLVDWTDLICFDTVRTENEIEKANPFETPLYFIRIDYEKEERFAYEDQNGETYYEWEVVDSISSNSFNDNKTILSKLGYSGDYKNLITFLNAASKSSTKSRTTVSFRYIMYEEIISSFEPDKRSWANEINILFKEFFNIEGVDTIDVDQNIFVDGLNSGYFQYPLKERAKITSPYGQRYDPITGAAGDAHFGTDLGVPVGTPVYAAAEGKISILNKYNNNDAGIYIIIVSNFEGKTVKTQYFHLSKIGNFKVGDTVKKGQQIAFSGNTGKSSGPHLHFGMKIEGQYVNPQNYIKF